MFELNVTTTFNVARAAIPVLLERGGGSFVAVSAQAAQSPFPGAAAYISAKAAVLAFVRALDAEYGERGHPGQRDPAVDDRHARPTARPCPTPTARAGPRRPQIGEVIRFLISSEASAVRGAALPV